MSYEVKITDTKTGETVSRTYPYEWSDREIYWWTDGNFGCDSNRGMEFMRAKGEEPEDFPACNCGKSENRWTVILPNGRQE